MKKQPDLFDPLAYPNGPGHRGVPTSVAAAESIRPHLGPLQAKIVAFLGELGRSGATYQQVVDGCAMAVPTVCGRMFELVEAKIVKIAPERRLTKSRRKARVYVLAEHLPQEPEA